MSDLKWISVKDLLPTKSGNVLVIAVKNDVRYVWIYHYSMIDNNFVGNDLSVVTERVTFWMPLPEPPKP